MTTKSEAIQKLTEAGLESNTDSIATLALPSVALTPKQSSQARLRGTSRLGGSPDLASALSWPEWKGQPLEFLCQLRIQDFAAYPCCNILPSTGYLYFFYDREQSAWGFDPNDQGSSRVLFADDNAGELVHRTDPRSADEKPAQAIIPYEELTFPSLESRSIMALGLSEGERESYLSFLEEVAYPSSQSEPSFEPIHRLLGHPQEIQGEMQIECQLASSGVYCGGSSSDPRMASLEQGADDWRLLLQLDSDDELWMWGDFGRLYFWIRQDDLIFRRFDRTWMILQCS